ncbi:MAG: hypothetical protein OXN27_23035 [Candidatus Poribacteria bacterium]|nr:hypothetical protein [Candidatus Poribacteria bacterium]
MCRPDQYRDEGRVHYVKGAGWQITDKDWRVQRLKYMADGKTIILGADETGIKNRRHGTYNIYRYHIPSDTMTQLTHLPGRNHSPDWVEGALDVSPKEKKPVAWGEVKRDSQ